ncbi:MAG: VWA domain-containing protein [Alphaproteobacteria bacterium]|nr:VWA domain-containing protein [Alphaproteobacteria bacterium]
MTLGAPSWLHLLWALPVLVGVVWWASARRRRDLARLMAAGLLQRHLPPGLEQRRAWRATLTLLGLSLAVVAAAQPRWGFTWRDLDAEGLEVIVALDLSRSMDAKDVDPSRLERARREIGDLLELLPGDRVGLVIFAAGAYPRVPLTVDHDALRTILRDTDTDVLQAQGSSIAEALRVSLDLFGEDTGVDRAVVLLSDGESWDEDTAQAAAALQEAGVRVYALGVGTEEGAPIPETGGGFKTDRSGEVVITRLNEDALRQVAATTGGAYVRSVAGAGDVRGLVGELRSVMQRTSVETRREKVWDERFQYPLAAGVGLIMLGVLLGDGRRAAVLVAVLLCCGVARAEGLDDARQLMDAGEPGEAIELLHQLQVADPQDPQVLWALGEACYEAGRYADAADAFDTLAERAPQERQRVQARYNAGNARYHAGRLDEAVADWEQVLSQDPDHEAANHNAEAVRQEIAARMQPPQQQPQSGQGDPDAQPQDGEGEKQDAPPQQGENGPEAPPDAQQGEESGQPQEGEGTRPEKDTASPEGEGGQAAQDTGAPEDTGSPSAGGEEAPPEGVDEMSAAEAQRLLDGVEEGRPRVVVRGASKEKDW